MSHPDPALRDPAFLAAYEYESEKRNDQTDRYQTLHGLWHLFMGAAALAAVSLLHGFDPVYNYTPLKEEAAAPKPKPAPTKNKTKDWPPL